MAHNSYTFIDPYDTEVRIRHIDDNSNYKENISSKAQKNDKPPMARPRKSIKESIPRELKTLNARRGSVRNDSIEVLSPSLQQADINYDSSPYKSNLYSFK